MCTMKQTSTASILFAFSYFLAEVQQAHSFPTMLIPTSPFRPMWLSNEEIESCASRKDRTMKRMRRSELNSVKASQPDAHVRGEEDPMRAQLWSLLSQAPSQQITSASLTKEILSRVETLERQCPTNDNHVLSKLSGTWELLWTTQDGTPVLPHETLDDNDDKEGRSNPVLPTRIQKRLESVGVMDSRGGPTGGSISASTDGPRSIQLIDVPRNLATNVVSFRLFRRIRVSLAIAIHVQANAQDPRRIDVEFQSCRISVPAWKLDVYLPLALLGLRGLLKRGWLRTTYIDDTFRITRGHRGSVFVLARPSSRRKQEWNQKLY